MSETTPSNTRPADESGIRLLAVDDNINNLEVLFQALSTEGYELLVAQSGEEALEVAPAAMPHLVLLDIAMPGMDGYEVARRLKADPKTREIPIIFVSAMDDPEDKVRAFKAGGVDYVTKPLQVEEVIARVETHLSISRMQDQINRANEKLLAWNVEMSQRGRVRVTSPDISPELAALFGKAESELAAGDETRQSLTVVACAAPDLALSARVEASIGNHLGGSLIARFGGILVAVSPADESRADAWRDERFASENLRLAHGAGDGVLRIVEAESGGSALRLDFDSPAVLNTLAALRQVPAGQGTSAASPIENNR